MFEIALSGESAVSDPIYDDNGTDIVMAYAVPVVTGNEVSGVLMAIRDGLELSEFAKRIQFGETGEAFIINKHGRTIAHADTQLLLDIIENRAADAVTGATQTLSSESSTDTDTLTSATVEESLNGNDLGFENFNDVQKKMTEGETGFDTYKYKGVSKVTGFAPIPPAGPSLYPDRARSCPLIEFEVIILVISCLFLPLVGVLLMGKNIPSCCGINKTGMTMSEGDFTMV